MLIIVICRHSCFVNCHVFVQKNFGRNKYFLENLSYFYQKHKERRVKMYLSVLKPNSYTKSLATGLVKDEQVLHKILSSLFEKSRVEEDLLYKKIITNCQVIILLQSKTMPKENSLFQMTTVSANDRFDLMNEGSVFTFNLTTYPFVKKNGKRYLLKTPEERTNWLKRKGEQNGFELIAIKEGKKIKTQIKHPEKKGNIGFLNGYEYSGILKVTNKEKFVSAYQKGIGPQKAYGYGMLILKEKVE